MTPLPLMPYQVQGADFLANRDRAGLHDEKTLRVSIEWANRLVMRKINPLPSQADLVDLFYYDPNTGLLAWRGKASRKHHPGRIAGTLHHSGYLQVRVAGTIYLAHRLIWKRQTGREPIEVDHRNGVRDDNRWSNLRDATRSMNMVNRAAPNHHRGVHWMPARQKFGAQIKAEGTHLWIGSFDTAEEACAAYRAKAAELHLDFARRGACSCL